MPVCSGDFKPWSQDELQTMKEAGDREAGKLEQETGAEPSASSSKVWLPSCPCPPACSCRSCTDCLWLLLGHQLPLLVRGIHCASVCCGVEARLTSLTRTQGRKKQQQQQMQEQHAQNIQDGHPRVWVPGQGWVAIDPDWERQDNSPSTHHEDAQASAHEQVEAGPSQERAQGYDADSETDGSELQGGPASDKAEAGSTQSADAEPDEDQKQHRDEERREGKPVQSAYGLSQGVQVAKDSGREGEEHDSAERWQEEAEKDTERTNQEHVGDQDEGRRQSERQSNSESREHRQQDQNMSASGTAEGQQQQTTSEPSHSSAEHVEEKQPRKLRYGRVRCIHMSLEGPQLFLVAAELTQARHLAAVHGCDWAPHNYVPLAYVM